MVLFHYLNYLVESRSFNILVLSLKVLLNFLIELPQTFPQLRIEMVFNAVVSPIL